MARRLAHMICFPGRGEQYLSTKRDIGLRCAVWRCAGRLESIGCSWCSRTRRCVGPACTHSWQSPKGPALGGRGRALSVSWCCAFPRAWQVDDDDDKGDKEGGGHGAAGVARGADARLARAGWARGAAAGTQG
eukprot:764019-Prymnesium_polylepis.1